VAEISAGHEHPQSLGGGGGYPLRCATSANPENAKVERRAAQVAAGVDPDGHWPSWQRRAFPPANPTLLLDNWRREAGLRLSRAARLLGVRTAYLRELEAGAAPTAEDLAAIRRVTGHEEIAPLRDAQGPRSERLSPLSALIVSWRQQQDLTYAAAGSLVGSAGSTVRSWERGARPSPQAIVRLAAAMGADPILIYEAAGEDTLRRPRSSGGTQSTPLHRARVATGESMRALARRLHIVPRCCRAGRAV
jgi:transcriptional regulator with XRE-family HTH domain